MRRFTLLKISFLLFLTVGTAYILGGRREGTLHTAQGPIFGTAYTVSYVSSRPLDSLILNELQRVDASLSMFNPTSLVSRINRNETHHTDSLFTTIFRLAEQVSATTDGSYDITVAPLVNLWGFGFRHADKVTDSAVDSLLPLIDYRRVCLRGDSVVKADPRMMLDFSSIAKGYGVDRVAAMLEREGVKDYMIEIGGEVRIRGTHPEGRPWRIGIMRPEPSQRTVSSDARPLQATLSLSDGAMATSGNYLRFYEKEGRRYAHTIDPHTGRPVSHALLSATVIAPTCAMADAYATAFMVMGAKRAETLLSSHSELAAYFILDDGKGHYRTWQTDNFPATE